jgi:superfamily I DNA/RNA helicase
MEHDNLPTDPLTARDQVTARVLAHDYTEGPLLLLAGPGTGKSYSLKETIKKQSAKGYAVSDFYAMTLTKAAAGKFEAEVKDEISKEFDHVSTVHFRAKGILHKYADRVGLPKSFRVLTGAPSAEIEVVLSDIQQDFVVRGRNIGKKELKALFQEYQAAVANLQSPPDTDFANRFAFYRQFYRAVEWYDVIALACRILAESKDIRATESQLSPFLLVDEYQDLNPAEQELMRLLCNGRSTLLAVGDDDQSIYGGTMRYAEPSGILNFKSLFPTASKIILPVCSRCPTNILQKASELISRNLCRDSEKKPLLALPQVDERSLCGLVASVGLKSEKAEAEFVVAALRCLSDVGVPASEILVLCASKNLGTLLLQSVQKHDSGLKLQDCLGVQKRRLDAHQMLTYLLEFLENQEDNNLPLRILLAYLCCLKPKEILILRQAAVVNKQSLWSALSTARERGDLKESALNRIQRFVNCVEETNRQEPVCRLKTFAILYPLLEQAVVAWEASQNVIEQCAGEEARITQESPVTGIRFMTMHSSKGLDARYVFIPFMENDVLLGGKDVEERRRLLYVAITRARTAVILTWAWSRRAAVRYKAGGGSVTGRQRHSFLSECGLTQDIPSAELLRELRKLSEHEEKWLAAHNALERK